MLTINNTNWMPDKQLTINILFNLSKTKLYKYHHQCNHHQSILFNLNIIFSLNIVTNFRFNGVANFSFNICCKTMYRWSDSNHYPKVRMLMNMFIQFHWSSQNIFQSYVWHQNTEYDVQGLTYSLSSVNGGIKPQCRINAKMSFCLLSCQFQKCSLKPEFFQQVDCYIEVEQEK